MTVSTAEKKKEQATFLGLTARELAAAGEWKTR
jgi:hypothetical protein